MSYSAWLSKVKALSNARPQSALKRPSFFMLAGTSLFLLCMLVGIYLFFPAEALKQRLIQEIMTRTGAQVQIEQVSLYPLLTLDAKRITYGVPGLSLPLEIEQLRIVPQWFSLLSGDPGAQLQAHIMNGTITAVLQKSGAISAEALGLRFDLPWQKPMPFNLVGTLTEVTLNSSLGLGVETKTGLSLRLAEVNILGLEIFSENNRGLNLGAIDLELDGLGRALRITSLTAKGGDLEVSGDGMLQVGPTSATSRIRLTLQVRPGPNADPSIVSLLQLAGEPEADGSYSLQLTGSLAKPTFKL